MTRRRLAGLALGLVLLGVALAVGVGQTDDPDTRRVYLMTIVILYTMAIVVWILLAVLVKVVPDAQGEVERHLKPRQSHAMVPEEVIELASAIRKGRRRAHYFRLFLEPRMDSLRSEAPSRPSWEGGRLPKVFSRLRRGPSAKKLAAMLDRIEET